MKREDVEAKLRELAEHRMPVPAEIELRAMGDSIWAELRAPRSAGRRRALWIVPLAATAAAAALWLLLVPRGRPPAPIPEPMPRAWTDLDDGGARSVLSSMESEMGDDLREFERTLAEPASTGEMLLQMDDSQLRELLAALQKEKRS